MRLAWFSPMPPVRSGISAVSAGLIPVLRREHEIDVFVDEPVAKVAARTMSAHDFVWRHSLRPYDLTVFQLGNSSHHDYLWPYLFRYPGLVVLHDVHLHHARAAALLRSGRPDDYREEFAANHPDASPDAAELAVWGFDSFLYYLWPMTRLVVSASRLAAVHTAVMAAELKAEMAEAAIEIIALGHGEDKFHDEQRAKAAVRQRFGLRPDTLLFGLFGGVTPDKRVPQVLDAFASVLRYAPNAHLLIAGEPAAHYDVRADVRHHALDTHVTVTGYLQTDEELTECVMASDVTLNLRWPTARETSGPWLRCLAAGKPSVIVDLVQTTDVPSLDPRTWTVNGAGPPVCVAVDILDEDHSLRLAIQRLATDPDLRTSLGRAAGEYWKRTHTAARMVEDYQRVILAAVRRTAPDIALPAHLRDDGDGLLRELTAPFGANVSERIRAI
jgi:glycosyltransferase involved in cell wall biosynthesis